MFSIVEIILKRLVALLHFLPAIAAIWPHGFLFSLHVCTETLIRAVRNKNTRIRRSEGQNHRIRSRRGRVVSFFQGKMWFAGPMWTQSPGPARSKITGSGAGEQIRARKCPPHLAVHPGGQGPVENSFQDSRQPSGTLKNYVLMTDTQNLS